MDDHVKSTEFKSNIMIPKYRFDEVNNSLKAMKEKAVALEEENAVYQAQIENLCKQIEDIKSGYEKASTLLKVKEVFVSGGLTQQDYQELVNIISEQSNEDMIALANCITNLIKKKTNNN